MSDLFEMRRMIFDCHPDNLITAIRAAKWLLGRPNQKDAILAYGEGDGEVAFYVKRNKESISIRENTMRHPPIAESAPPHK
jgi:hypothetical protein